MPAAHRALHDHLRAAFQNGLRFLAQGMGKEDDRGDQEDDQRVDHQEREISQFSPPQGGKGEVHEGALSFNPFHIDISSFHDP